MKKYFFLIALFSVTVSSVYSQHIPPCQGVMHGNPGEGACWGYAVGRAFGRSWDDPRCPINSLTLQGVPTTYFDYAGFDINDVEVGDIVGWGGGVMHVAYIISINSRTNDGIKLSDRPYQGGNERPNLTLSYLITERGGNPDVYFRKKKLWSILVRNDVEGNNNVGKVGIYGGGYSGQYDSPKTADLLNWESYISVNAVFDGMLYNNYVRMFEKWTLDGVNISYSKTYNFTITNTNYSYSSTYEAVFQKQFNITFQNNFSGGKIKVNNIEYSAPTPSFPVVQGNTITGTAINLQVVNGIEYSFNHWSDGSTLFSKTFTPSNHTTYTAYFTGRPENSYRNLHDIGAVGEPIVLDWDEHPNTAVTQYKIYRQVKDNGVTGPVQLIGTRSRGTTTFTDNRYTKSRTYDEYLLFYDVRAYYSMEGTYSNPDFIAIYGAPPLQKNSDTDLVKQVIPKEYSLSNFPNPFNPTTVIEYQLPKAGFVEIKVFDAIGKEVATLVNEEKESGKYKARFGSNDLPSGMYIYTIKVNDYYSSKKMLLIK